MVNRALTKQDGVLKTFLSAKRDNDNFTLFPVGSYVWLPNNQLCYEPAKVVSAMVKGDDRGGRAVVERDGTVFLKEISVKEKKHIIPMQEKYLEPEPVIDLKSLDLSGAAILHTLRSMFDNDCDYLQIGGRTIIYVNRFEDDEYRMEKFQRRMEERMEGVVHEREPDIDTLASACLDGLNKSAGKQSQSCILFGHEGSGRRKLTQTFTRKIVQLSVTNDVDWWEKLNAADEILSVFGGEKFIRWAELHLQYSRATGVKHKGKLIGAALACFLLDTSSLTQASKAFECFYQLCQASSTTHRELRDRYNIKPSECYAYLNLDGIAAPVPSSALEEYLPECINPGCNLESYGFSNRCVVHQKSQGKICGQSGCSEIDYGKGFCKEHELGGTFDRERAWGDTLRALQLLEVTDQEIDSIIQMFVDMLELGNLNIAELSEKGCQDVRIGQLFGIDLEGIVEILSTKTIKVGSESFFKTLPKSQIVQRRDALVRALYSGLFNWLVTVINRGVSYTSEAKNTVLTFLNGNGDIDKKNRIGVISTLETGGLLIDGSGKDTNSLEQLINNYAQERFYTYYSINIMESVAANWANDGLAIMFPEGNEMCLPLILEPPKKTMNMKMSKASSTKPRAKRGSIFRMPSRGDKTIASPSGPNPFSREGTMIPTTGVRKGILDILEEELRIPGGSDKKLIGKIEKTHRSNKMLLLSPNKNYFKIHHFGANVIYDVKGFIKKTRSSVIPDEVRKNIIQATSKVLVVKFLTQHSALEQQRELTRITKKGATQIRNDARTLKHTKSRLHKFMDTGDANSDDEEDETYEFTRRVGTRVDASLERIKRKAKPRFSVARPHLNVDFGLAKSMNLAGVALRRTVSTKDNDEEGSIDYEDRRIVTPLIPNMGNETFSFVDVKNNPTGIPQSQFKGKERTDLENSLVVQNSMNTLITMLDTTSPHFVFCFKANKDRDFKKGFDSNFVYDQLQLYGIQQLFEKRLNKSSFGPGFKPEKFVFNYYALTLLSKKQDRQNVEAVCEKLAAESVFPESAYSIGTSGKVYIKTAYMGDLDSALSFAIEDLTILMQSVVRRFMVRCRFLRKMESVIVNRLELAADDNDKTELVEAIEMAKRWNMAYNKMNVAKSKLKRVNQDDELKKELATAAETRNAFALYESLNNAKQSGLHLCEELQYASAVYREIESERETMAKAGEAQRKAFMAGVIEELQEEIEFEKNFDVDEFIQELTELKKQHDQIDAKNVEKKESKIVPNGDNVRDEDEESDHVLIVRDEIRAGSRQERIDSDESDVLIVRDPIAKEPPPSIFTTAGMLSRTPSGRFKFLAMEKSDGNEKEKRKPKLSMINRTESGRFQALAAENLETTTERQPKLSTIERTPSGRFNFSTLNSESEIENEEPKGMLSKEGSVFLSTTFPRNNSTAEEEDEEEENESNWHRIESTNKLPFLKRMLSRKDSPENSGDGEGVIKKKKSIFSSFSRNSSTQSENGTKLKKKKSLFGKSADQVSKIKRIYSK